MLGVVYLHGYGLIWVVAIRYVWSRVPQDTVARERHSRRIKTKASSENNFRTPAAATMGKKSKRKAAKVASAVSGGTSSNGQQLILGPRPDGITCTNEDPNLCAVCTSVLPPGGVDHVIRICCGTMICDGCLLDQQCGFCRHRYSNARAVVSVIKKRANEGFPWACHVLAELYREGSHCFSQSVWESFRWHERAASKDHPVSCIYLAGHYAEGIGCKRLQEESRESSNYVREGYAPPR